MKFAVGDRVKVNSEYPDDWEHGRFGSVEAITGATFPVAVRLDDDEVGGLRFREGELDLVSAANPDCVPCNGPCKYGNPIGKSGLPLSHAASAEKRWMSETNCAGLRKVEEVQASLRTKQQDGQTVVDYTDWRQQMWTRVSALEDLDDNLRARVMELEAQVDSLQNELARLAKIQDEQALVTATLPAGATIRYYS